MWSLFGPSVSAHPPDLYQQIELLTLGRNDISLVWSIQPSAALVPGVWQQADTNGDEQIAAAEAETWANKRLAELTLTVDESTPIVWESMAVTWPASEAALADGSEAILIRLTAPWSMAAGSSQRLQLHNHFEENLSQHQFMVRSEETTAFTQPTAALGQLELLVLGLEGNGRFPSHITGTWHTSWDSTITPSLVTDSEHGSASANVSWGLVVLLIGLSIGFSRAQLQRHKLLWPVLLGMTAVLVGVLWWGNHVEETAVSPLTDTLSELSHDAHLHAAEPIPSLVLPEEILAGSSPEAAFSFIRNYIDTAYGGNGKPGWVRAGDMDNDTDLDIVAGGGTALFIYENDGNAGGWTRYGSLDGANAIGANGGVLFDVNNDTYLDIVSAQFNSNLGWWQNPGGTLSSTPWTFHVLSNEDRYLHDIMLADLDEDGKAEEFVANLNAGYWNADITIKWYRPGADPTQLWEAHTIEPDRNEGAPHGHAGMDTGDIDKDGNVDLAYSNGWYEAPDDPTGSWTWHEVSAIYGISNALLRDMDGDTNLDLIVSGGHHGQGLFWLEAPDDPISGSWAQHNISAVAGDVTQRRLFDATLDYLHHPECVSILDLDADSDLDIVVCDLFFGEDPNEPDWSDEAHNIYVYENQGDALTWLTHNVAPDSYPNHLLQTVDINEDGQMDIIGESSGHSVISYFENSSAGATAVNTPTICPNGGTFGGTTTINLATTTLGADIHYTLDGLSPDQGSLLYSAPFTITQSLTVQARGYAVGLDPSEVATADFTIKPFHFELDKIDEAYPGNGRPGWSASGDMNGDGLIDVVSGGGEAIQWYKAPTWSRHPIETDSTAGGNGGLVLDVDRDEDLDVVAALFNSQLVWWENPGSSSVTDPWTRHVIDVTSPQGYNHDLAMGDIDKDGEAEIVALYVASGGIVWYDIPANPKAGAWPATQILTTINDPFVGLTLADIDRDDDLDVVASNKWYERPSDPTTPNWTERTIITSAVQNVFAYDVNKDGRVDVVAAEGFENPNGRLLWAEAPLDPKTESWTEHVLDSSLDGPENIWAGDLNGDGNTDIVTGEMGTSTGYDDSDSNLLVFEGLNAAGTSWTMHPVAENVGVSARINPVDIDGDGDVDFTADGNAENHIYLWVNMDGSSPVECESGNLDEQLYLPIILR